VENDHDTQAYNKIKVWPWHNALAVTDANIKHHLPMDKIHP
jgi:hypothetical protein